MRKYPSVVEVPFNSLCGNKKFACLMETEDGRIYRKDVVVFLARLKPEEREEVIICEAIAKAWNEIYEMVSSGR